MYLCPFSLCPAPFECRYYSDRGTCSKCYLSCATCSGPRRDQCVTCPKDWQLASGECHPSCPMGFFKSEFGCQKCHHYCKTCSGKLNRNVSPRHTFQSNSRPVVVVVVFFYIFIRPLSYSIVLEIFCRTDKYHTTIFIVSFSFVLLFLPGKWCISHR